jgi:hypothetical protein
MACDVRCAALASVMKSMVYIYFVGEGYRSDGWDGGRRRGDDDGCDLLIPFISTLGFGPLAFKAGGGEE